MNLRRSYIGKNDIYIRKKDTFVFILLNIILYPSFTLPTMSSMVATVWPSR